MKERPILFSAPMVRALLAGTKTQTRRAVRKQFPADAEVVEVGLTNESGWQISGHSRLWWDDGQACIDDAVLCPYGVPGDRLWVRETFVQGWPAREDDCPDQFDADGNERPMTTWYRASNPELNWCTDGENTERTPWRPSIHMPRAASRILLEVTDVRVERLQDISDADALAEGIVHLPRMEGYGLPDGSHFHGTDPRISYWSLWDAINGQGAVEANPWVWAVSFRRFAP